MRAHRIIQEDGEAEVSACARYERGNGLEIGPDDFVIFRVIVDAEQGRAA